VHQALVREHREFLYVETAPAEAWDRIRKALQRAGGGFVRVAIGAPCTHSFLLATAALDGMLTVSSAEALRPLAEALQKVCSSSGEPVTCSEGWLPSPERKHRWRRAGPIPASDLYFENALGAERAEGTLTSKILEPRAAAVWRFENDVPEEERERIRERMFGHVLAA
jgi:hypothetical protein